MATPGVNLRVLRKEISVQSKRAIEPRAEAAMEKEFAKIKNQLLRDFDRHPVTNELEDGNRAESNYVNTSHGGNLFSLLGFKYSQKPIQKLRRILENSIKFAGPIKTRVRGNKIIIEKTVSNPSLDTISSEVGSASKLDWTNRSWLDLLEKGITGFASYLFDEEQLKQWSRSKTAIEAKDKNGNLIKVRDGSLGPIRYISDLLLKFRNRISKTK